MLTRIARQTIILGVLDLGDAGGRGGRGGGGAHPPRLSSTCPPSASSPAPDCGMKYLAREIAFGKLQRAGRGAAIVRAELA